MAVEVIRKLINGVWRTVAEDAGGNGGSQTVSDGTTTVADVSRIDFAGATVMDGGAGVAQVQAFPVTVLGSTVQLTNADILTLPSLPFEIAPTPGPGKFILPISAFGTWHVEGDYAGTDGGARWQLFNGMRENSGFVVPNLTPGDFGNHFIQFPPFGGFDSVNGYFFTPAYRLTEWFEDLPLNIADLYNGVADYTGGDPANTLTITALYTILDV